VPKPPDALDRKLIYLLGQDGSLSAQALAERLGVTPPTVRTRMRALEEAGLLRVAGLVDAARFRDLTTALIGLNVRAYGKLDEVLERLEAVPAVTWAAVVTGRYDIVAEVVVEGGMEELYRLTCHEIPKVGQVDHSETFVVMRSRGKWVRPPKGLEQWAGGGEPDGGAPGPEE